MKGTTEVIEASWAPMTMTMTTDGVTAATTDHDITTTVYLPMPRIWNESQIPYLGDLSPKPTLEILVKVRPTAPAAL